MRTRALAAALLLAGCSEPHPLGQRSLAPLTGSGSGQTTAPIATVPGELNLLDTPIDIRMESSYCYTLEVRQDGDLDLWVTGMDSHQHRELGILVAGTGLTNSFHTSGMALLGGELVFAAYNGNNGQWFSVDVAARTITPGPDALNGDLSVASTETQLVTMRQGTSRQLGLYDSFDALTADNPGSIVFGDYHFSRYAVSGPEVFGAWHSTDVIDVHDLHNGDLLRTIPLEAWDTWVWGVSVAGGYLHLLDDGGQDPEMRLRLNRFDLETGSLIDEVFIRSWPGRESGLLCGP